MRLAILSLILFFIGTASVKAQDLQQIIELITQNQFSRAEKMLTQHLKQQPDDLDALRWLSLIYLNNQDFTQAVNVLERCQKIAPNDPSITLELGKALKRAGQWSEAEKQLKKVYSNTTLQTSAGILLADLYYEQNRFKKALKFYKELILNRPQNSYFYRQAGRCALKLNDYRQAESFLQKALQLNSRDIESYILLFNVLKKKERWSEALQTVQQGLLHFSTNPSLLLAAADCQFALKRYPEAIGYYQAALANGDSSAYLYKKLGAAYYYANNYASALLALKKSIQKDKKDPISYYFLGLVQKALNLEQKAIASLQKAIDLSLPAFLPDVYFQMAEAWQRQKKYSRAIAFYKKVLEADTARVMPLFYMATIYDEVYKDRQTPLRYYQKFLERADESIPDRYKNYALERMKAIREQLHFQKGRKNKK